MAELAYLLTILAFCAWILGSIGYVAGAQHGGSPGHPAEQSLPFGLLYPKDRHFLIWVSVALSGIVGGTAFALKWLYHSVAKDTWNHDRIVWRFVVPILSGVFAVFVAFMVTSGLVPFLDERAFDKIYKALGAGFFLGLFSDNVLAKLQRLANQWFGLAGGKADNG